MFLGDTPTAILISLGPITVRWYGLLIALGAIIGYLVTRRLARVRGVNVAELDTLVAMLLLAGILGARIFDVSVFEGWYFVDHPWEVFAIWRGGLSFHGALIGGALVLVWWCRKRGESMLKYLDVFAPGLALGQAIGRWGNYFNQELFGRPTSLPWGIPISPTSRPIEYRQFDYFHPVFLYEFLLLVALAAVLWRLRSKFSNGRLFALYLMASGIIRFALEFLRVDEQTLLLGIRVGFLVAAVVVVVGAVLFWFPVKSKPSR